jgi:hypothetical protein
VINGCIHTRLPALLEWTITLPLLTRTNPYTLIVVLVVADD